MKLNLKEYLTKLYALRTVLMGAALDEYLVATIMFVVIGVAVSIGAYITSSVQVQVGALSNTCSAGNTINPNTGLCNAGVTGLSVAYNAAGQSVSGLNTFATWLPILAIVIIAVVIIALLYGFLTGGSRTGGQMA